VDIPALLGGLASVLSKKALPEVVDVVTEES
jgi:hypothetical protein